MTKFKRDMALNVIQFAVQMVKLEKAFSKRVTPDCLKIRVIILMKDQPGIITTLKEASRQEKNKKGEAK